MKMEMTTVQKLARVLKILVTVTFVCNLIALFAVPVMALLTPREAMEGGMEGLSYLFRGEAVPDDYIPFTMVFLGSWLVVWTKGYTAVLTVFLWACGICTAIILWQARRVLDTILIGETFSLKNAANMKRAAICCLIISLAALARLIWGFFYYKSIAPLLTYNGLFVPVFAMGFLLCMVMSALFRQAAEMKEENDLTI